MKMLNRKEFILECEGLVNSQIRGNYPVDWDEDFLTRGLLKALRQELGREFMLSSYFPSFVSRASYFSMHVHAHVHVRWNVYKMKGKEENKFGDVAILVKVRYYDRDVIEGVAFMEAKRRYTPSGKFDAIDVNQLRRINQNAPRASVLLYDFAPIVYPYKFSCLCTHAATVPMDLVLATGKKGVSLYKFSTPFSKRLLRHLLGFDLERGHEALKIAKGYRQELGAPRNVGVFAVGVGVRPPALDEIDINPDRFEPIIEE